MPKEKNYRGREFMNGKPMTAMDYIKSSDAHLHQAITYNEISQAKKREKKETTFDDLNEDVWKIIGRK